MLAIRNLVLALTVTAIGLATAGPASSFDLATLLGVQRREDFKLIHVDDLAQMLADKSAKVAVFDANPPGVRATEGMIPGAHLLSSSGHYDIDIELPADKSTRLVFYCHNTH